MEYNSWRCSTYASVATSLGSERDFLPALEPLLKRIDSLLKPFAHVDSHDRLKYRKYPQPISVHVLRVLMGAAATKCIAFSTLSQRWHSRCSASPHASTRPHRGQGLTAG